MHEIFNELGKVFSSIGVSLLGLPMKAQFFGSRVRKCRRSSYWPFGARLPVIFSLQPVIHQVVHFESRRSSILAFTVSFGCLYACYRKYFSLIGLGLPKPRWGWPIWHVKCKTETSYERVSCLSYRSISEGKDDEKPKLTHLRQQKSQFLTYFYFGLCRSCCEFLRFHVGLLRGLILEPWPSWRSSSANQPP